MKRTKKLFALIASLCLVMSMGTAVANAADTPEPLFTKQAIERYAGATRYDTSLATADALKASLGVSQFEAVVLAYGGNFPDALAGGYLANVKNAPVITVDTTAASENKVEAYLKSNLKSNGDVYILGGTGVVTPRFEKALKADGYSVKRLAGASRYDTNLATIKEAGKSDKGLLVCSGNGYADSLSASAVDMPILLVNTSITKDQQAYIDEYAPSTIYIVGGTGVVSTAIEKSLASKYDVKRVAGVNRHKTSVAVAEEFFDSEDIDTVTFAYAQNFPDGLSGGPLAASLGAPMILTETSNHADAKAYRQKTTAFKSVTFGGTALIDDNAVADIMYNYMTVADTHEELLYGDYLIIDVRKAEDYAASHIWNSYSAPVNMSNISDADAEANIKAVLDRVDGDSYTGVILVCYTGNKYAKAATAVLANQGVDPRCIYTMQGGKSQWDKSFANDVAKSYTSTGNFDFLNGITVAQAKKDIDDHQELMIIDVRDTDSYMAGHIPGAISAALCDKDKNAYSVSKQKEIMEKALNGYETGLYAIVCYSGNSYVDRARTALESLGIPEEQIISVEGGQKAWKEAGYAEDTYNYVSPMFTKSVLGYDYFVLLDTRAAADYEIDHVAGSVSASCNSIVQAKPITPEDGDAKANIEAAVAKYGTDKQYIVVCYSGNRYATEGTDLLVEAGVIPSNIYILGDSNWQQSSKGGMIAFREDCPEYITKSYTSTKGIYFKDGITVDQLKADIDGYEAYTILDVRDAKSYKEGHVPGAISTPLADASKTAFDADKCKAKLKAAYDENPSGLFAIICYSGNNYVDLARTYLMELGAEEQQIIAVEGGEAAWKAKYDEATYKYVNTDDVYDAITDENVVIIDTRKAKDYATKHIIGSVNASCDSIVKPAENVDGEAADNIKAVVDKYGVDKKYYVVCYSGNRYATAGTDLLIDAGVDADNILILGGYDRKVSSAGGMKAWNEDYGTYVAKSYTSTGGFEFMNGITVDQLNIDMTGDEILTIVDVRDTNSYNAGHIPGAISAPLCDADKKAYSAEEQQATLKQVVDAYPGGQYVIVCYSGNSFVDKARTALAAIGVTEKQVISLEGGIGAWKKADYDVDVVVEDESKIFVDADWLLTAQAGGFSNVDPDNLVVAHVTYTAAADGTECIPGSINVTSIEVEDADGLAPSTDGEYVSWNAAYNLLDQATIRANCIKHGITADTTVVVYGAGESMVARQALGYMFAGVKDVKMLCYGNGVKSWKAEGNDTVTSYVDERPAASFGTPAAGCEKYVDTMADVQKEMYGEDGLGDNYKTSSFKLVSIRSQKEFNGETSGYGYMCRAGEPEGAVFGNDGIFIGDDGRIVSLEDLEEGAWADMDFATDGSQHLSFYCGTGWRAAVPFLICLEAGMDNVSVYDGGWYEWSMDTVVDFNEGSESGASKVHTPLHPDNRVQIGSTICTVKDLPTNKSTKK